MAEPTRAPTGAGRLAPDAHRCVAVTTQGARCRRWRWYYADAAYQWQRDAFCVQHRQQAQRRGRDG